jgi:hypothetical protein
MSSITISQQSSTSHPGAVRTYVSNVGRATRTLIAALLAVKVEQPAAPASREVSPRGRVKSLKELYRMANQCDSIAPNLASELRHFAGQM